MANDGIFALRYAHAFASVRVSAGLDATQAQVQLADFAATLQGSAPLREILDDPSVAADQKLSVLDAIADRIGMYREVRNFIAVIVDHGRLGELPLILSEYHKLADQGAGLAEVEVTSARALNEDDRRELEFEISKLAVSRITVAYALNPALLGGAVVRIGSTIYDGSVRGQLERMKHTLTAS